MIDWLDERFILRRQTEEDFGQRVSIDDNRRAWGIPGRK
jgi:hypothetical protein